MHPIYTIGCSTNTHDQLAARLKTNGVTLLIDVRSKPYSKWAPHLNRPALAVAMNERGIEYLYGGTNLGGLNEKANDDPAFINAMLRVIDHAKTKRLAMMCSERGPEKCHRQYKLSAWLLDYSKNECAIRHILIDGSFIDGYEFAKGLLKV